MSLETKAKELADVMKETEEYQGLNSAQTRVKLDPVAQDLLTQLQTAQQELQQAQAQGQQITPDQISQFQSLEQQAQNNLTLQNLIKAQQAFGEVMNTVNEKLGEELFGSQ